MTQLHQLDFYLALDPRARSILRPRAIQGLRKRIPLEKGFKGPKSRRNKTRILLRNSCQRNRRPNLICSDGYEKLRNGAMEFLGSDKPMKVGEVSTTYFKNPITAAKSRLSMRVIVLILARLRLVRANWRKTMIIISTEIEPQPEGRLPVSAKDGILGKTQQFHDPPGRKQHQNDLWRNKRLKKGWRAYLIASPSI